MRKVNLYVVPGTKLRITDLTFRSFDVTCVVIIASFGSCCSNKRHSEICLKAYLKNYDMTYL